MRMVVLAISLGVSTLSASAMEFGSAAPLSIQQLDHRRYVPRLPIAPGPPIVRRGKKSREESRSIHSLFAEDWENEEHHRLSIPNIRRALQCRI